MRLIADSITFADGMTLALNPQTLGGGFGDPVCSSLRNGHCPGRFAADASPPTGGRASHCTFKAARDIVLPAGTTIAPGIGGRVTLTGANAIVRGVIDAPAGTITVAGSNVTLESTARLLARGATRIMTDVYGRRIGTVLDGGSVNLDALDDIAIQPRRADRRVRHERRDRCRRWPGAPRAPIVRSPSAVTAEQSTSEAEGLSRARSWQCGRPRGRRGRAVIQRWLSTCCDSTECTRATVYCQVCQRVWQSRISTQDLDHLQSVCRRPSRAASVTAAGRAKGLNASRNGGDRVLTVDLMTTH